MSQRTNRTLPSDFSLGALDAEVDPLLSTAFYFSGHYAAAERRDDPRCFLVGRTGGGKTAALRHLEATHAEHTIRINPEDLSLPYITDLGVIKYLTSLDVHLDPFFIALWKHVLLVEVIRHRYKIDSPGAKKNIFATLMQRVARDPAKKQALDYLNDFQDRFWCETDERVKDITTKFEEQVNAEANASFGIPNVAKLGTSASTSGIASTERRAEQADRFQRVINETQLARLNKMISVLDEYILDSEQNFTYIVIDDLDQDWVDEHISNTLIRCLFRAVRDLRKVRNLKIIVALRTNIFEQLDFGGRGGGQEEKFSSLILRMRWSSGELINLLDERARVASDKYGVTGITGLRSILPETNRARGNAATFILDRTLMRPRDAIAYLNEGFVLAGGRPRLSWNDIQRAERPYSINRLSALRDEWKATYPGIDRLFDVFTHCVCPMTRENITGLLDEAAMLLAKGDFPGEQWMTDLAQPIWDNSAAEWVDMYYPLLRLLFNLGFLGCGSETGSPLYIHDDPEYGEQASNFDSAAKFYIHPAFRIALDIETTSPAHRRQK
jgi:hypothetical protein